MHNFSRNFRQFLDIAKAVYESSINIGGNFPMKQNLSDGEFIVLIACLPELIQPGLFTVAKIKVKGYSDAQQVSIKVEFP